MSFGQDILKHNGLLNKKKGIIIMTKTIVNSKTNF